MRRYRLSALSSGLLILLASVAQTRAADWPMWRHDARRGAASPKALPDKLHVHWVRELPPLKPAWPDQPRMQFDACYEPVVLGKLLFFGSSRDDSVTALDTRSGNQAWRVWLDGPIRFAPVAWEDRLFVCCDDGCLYCLDAATGKRLWRFRGGPTDRKIIGNERLISTWPARGAPVVADDTVYFAASIWPFMGTFIHALDARTGRVRWTNDGDGAMFIKQPHYADSFAGVAPQGHLVIAGDRLLIPGGRSVPAVYDRKTGKLLQYLLAENGRRGGHEVAAAERLFFNAGSAFDLKDAKYQGEVNQLATAAGPATPADKARTVIDGDTLYTHVAGACRAFDLKSADFRTEETIDRKGEKASVTRWGMEELAACKTPPVQDLIKAGTRLYAAADSNVLAIDLDDKTSGIAWSLAVQGTVARLLAADGRLFAVTLEGRIYCFGADERTVEIHRRKPPRSEQASARAAATVAQMLTASKARAGYAVVWGARDAELVMELVRQSELHVVVVDADAGAVQTLWERLSAADFYGTRAVVYQADPVTLEMPPYLASFAVVTLAPDAKLLPRVFQSLRPYGGRAYFTRPAEHALNELVGSKREEFANARIVKAGGMTCLMRDGPLPGAGNWTHEHADAANTRVSPDRLVKAPLGILWFGGPGNDGVLPRHGHGPQPQFIDGRVIVEGVHFLRALDAYTGRMLWQVQLPGVGSFFNNLAHQPGANSSGTNYISMSDGIYVALEKSCLRLDPDTGKPISEFRLPMLDGMKEPPRWGYLNVVGDYLVAGADPLIDVPEKKPAKKKADNADDDLNDLGLSKLLGKAARGANDNLSSSKHLLVMDRHTGKVIWMVTARDGFRHNGICVGGGRLYAIDRLSGPQLARLKRRGEEPDHEPRLSAYDLKTGRRLWSSEDEVFGTWLSYSARHDVLVEAGRVARDTISDEPRGMRAFRAADGKVLWFDKTLVGPAMIHGDTILQGQGACELLTGKVKTRLDPVSGVAVPWEWLRTYGCNTPAASEHLLTFRSGAAGFYDLCNDGGTANLGGFRSSCTNNLIVGGGLLNAPDYTRTCTCSYQNQTSLALVHMPEAELWTYFGTRAIKGPIRRLGINLGAPGDRRADDGTLWIEYPSTGGYSPTVAIKTVPAQPEWFRQHSSRVHGKLNWVASSGARGLSSISIGLNDPKEDARKFTIRLHFMEPDGMKTGDRLMDIYMQNHKVAADLDIVKESGGPNRALVKVFTGIGVEENLVIRLSPSASRPAATTILCGIEMVAEEGR